MRICNQTARNRRLNTYTEDTDEAVDGGSGGGDRLCDDVAGNDITRIEGDGDEGGWVEAVGE